MNVIKICWEKRKHEQKGEIKQTHHFDINKQSESPPTCKSTTKQIWSSDLDTPHKHIQHVEGLQINADKDLGLESFINWLCGQA